MANEDYSETEIDPFRILEELRRERAKSLDFEISGSKIGGVWQFFLTVT
jgi:hypothetical protein